MSESDTWCRPSVSGCSAVHCVIRVQAAEHCLLSCCPGVLPTGMLSAITGCQLGEGILNWFNLRCSLDCYCTCLCRRRKKKEAFVLVMPNYLIENWLGWTVALLSALVEWNTWRATVESLMDSCALISILGHKWKPLEQLQEVASAANACLDKNHTVSQDML